jgi:hypothetical protein
MIYVIESGDYFKVGYAKNVKVRMTAYQTHNPNYNLVATVFGETETEKLIHHKLRDFKHKNEWFNKFDGWLNEIAFIINFPFELENNFIVLNNTYKCIDEVLFKYNLSDISFDKISEYIEKLIADNEIMVLESSAHSHKILVSKSGLELKNITSGIKPNENF